MAAACSSSDDTEAEAATTVTVTDDTSATTDATTTTLPPAADYTVDGPHPVGVITLELATGSKVEVWYPAVEGTTGSETYDIRDFVPEGVKALLTGDAPSTYTYDAGREADAADGRFPVVLFSHGFSGMRLQSTFLTAHLASWGMIVVSPDHPSRDLENVLGATSNGNRAESVTDLLGALDLVIAADAGDGPLGGHVDAEHVAAVGHSAGGGTILGAAADDRIDGYVSLASGALGESESSTPTALPEKPSFFMAGAIDAVVTVESVTRPAFERAPSPSLLWVLDEVGHNGFDDFCTFGGGTGIIGVAEASGLGGLLDANPSLRRLGEDGCVAPAVPVETIFPIVRAGVTAWLMQLFGPAEVSVDVPSDAAVAVEVQSR